MVKKLVFTIFIVSSGLLYFSKPLLAKAEDSPDTTNINSGQEVIHSFNSDITVNSDNSLKVTETITVTANGKDIIHGIYRDFPTTYHDRFWQTKRVAFTVQNVEQDGHTEPYHFANLDNRTRIYIGDPSVELEKKEYTYTLTYLTDRQLISEGSTTVLDWNVTGYGWVFPIEKVSATIHLPKDGQNISIKALSGPPDNLISHLTSTNSNASVVFDAPLDLKPGEGLRIIARWPEQTAAISSSEGPYFFRDYPDFVLALLGILVASIVLLWPSYKNRLLDARHVVAPSFAPPNGLSPAACAFLVNPSSTTQFAATLINAGTKKSLTIQEVGGTYTLVSKNNTEILRPEERGLLKLLFKNSGTVFFGKEYDSSIQAAAYSLNSELGDHYQGLVLSNSPLYLRSLLVALYGLLVLAILNFIGVLSNSIFLMFFISIFFSFFFVFPYIFFTLLENKYPKAALIIKRLYYFCACAVVAIFLVVFSQNSGSFWYGILIAFIYIAIAYTLTQPRRFTKEGQTLVQEILGYKLYLKTAEEKYLNLTNPPEKTPQLFETGLPYALALGVNQQWSQKFATAISLASYHPDWYSSSTHFSNIGAFSSSLNSGFSSTLSNASTAPSSSGGGGGSSSGGGGGGGGGGGW